MAEPIYPLRNKLLTRAHILDGISELSKENNQRVIQALSYAGEILNEKYPNDVFGLLLKGSRIKGYHTPESDADLIIVCPEGSDNGDNINDILAEAKKRYGVEDVGLDSMAQKWDATINLNDFLYQCDHEPAFFNSLIGYELSSNPNLLMARLTALKVISRGGSRFGWNYVRDRYNFDYLGDGGSTNLKVSERLGVSLDDVNKLLSPSMWIERYRRFTLPSCEDLLLKYESEFRRLKGKGKFVMHGVHKKVMKDLELGF